MKPKNRLGNFLTAITVLLALLFFAPNAKAQVSHAAPSTTPFGSRDKSGSIDKTIEPSAVEPIGDGQYLLVADDKKDLVVVEKSTGQVLGPVPKIKNERSQKWEAMAKDGDDFYVIGAHRDVNESRLFGFRVKFNCQKEMLKFEIIEDSVTEFDMKESLKNLNLGTVKIEGLAIRTLYGKKQLVIGFREPFDSKNRVQVYSADLPSESDIKPFTTLTLNQMFNFSAGSQNNVPFQLSSIEYVRELGGFLVITSTEKPSYTSMEMRCGSSTTTTSTYRRSQRQIKIAPPRRGQRVR